MTRETNLLCRVLDALRDSQTLHELSYRLGTRTSDAAGFSDPMEDSSRQCQVILQEHACLAVDIEGAIREALLPRVGVRS